jgi:hypothetical protein
LGEVEHLVTACRQVLEYATADLGISAKRLSDSQTAHLSFAPAINAARGTLPNTGLDDVVADEERVPRC